MVDEGTVKDDDIWLRLMERRRHAQENLEEEDPNALALMALLLSVLQGSIDRLSEAHLDDATSLASAFFSAAIEAFTVAVYAIRDGFPLQAYPTLRFALECASVITGLAHASPDDQLRRVADLRAALKEAAGSAEGKYKVESSAFRKILEEANENAQAEGQFRWLKHLDRFAHPSPYAVGPYYIVGKVGDLYQAARLGRQSAIPTLFGIGQVLGHALCTMLGEEIPELDAILNQVDALLAKWSEQTMPEGAVLTAEDLLEVRRTRLANTANTSAPTKKISRTSSTPLEC